MIGDLAASTREEGTRLRGPLRLLRAALFLVLAIGIALSAGFVGFAERIAAQAPPSDPRAEGIVVLTGGTSRIDEALELLAEGRARRLLISGVNPAVTRSTLAGTISEDLRSVLACCVDLDYVAEDTVGNAAETRDWAARQGFRSLIVVTSDYHMPRSMAELAKAMPDRRLIPFPVSNPDLHLARWWREGAAFTLLLREYGKFLVAEARRMIAPPVASTDALAKG